MQTSSVIRWCTATLSALLLLSCAVPPDWGEAVGATRVFRCDDGFRFVTRTEPQRLWLFLQDGTSSLPQVPSASGLHYSDGDVVLRAHGEHATLRLRGRVHAGCVSQPEEAPWEDARLRGVEFRASGNGPGWSLEVDEGRSLVFVERAGTDGLVFSVPIATRGDVRTSYAAGEDGRHIRVDVHDTPCDEAASDGTLRSVTVTLNERIYRGCGRWLARDQ